MKNTATLHKNYVNNNEAPPYSGYLGLQLLNTTPKTTKVLSIPAGKSADDLKVHKLYIKNMISLRCKMMVKAELSKLNIIFGLVDLGEVETMDEISAEQHEQLKEALLVSGLELMDDKNAILVEKIKNVIIEMIHSGNELPKMKVSLYLSEKLNYSYTYLSNLFSAIKGISILHFTLMHKIERVKELLSYGELTLSEISYKLQYSSISHLSNQFKKITGLSPSFYMQLHEKRKTNLEDL